MPETPARGKQREERDKPAQVKEESPSPKQQSRSKRDDAVLRGVRSLSTPPGEPYNDPEYGRS